ncbi:chromatin binding protein [Cryptococcus deuterogattii MMRL2647]|nr:chromatin binding protein [Cryptococcus deuterogattii MMRL2647]
MGLTCYIARHPTSGQHIRGFRAHKAEPSDASDTEDRPVAPVPPQSSVSSSSSTVPAIRHLVSHTAAVLSVAFSPKSNLLATGSFDESTIIWDVRRGKVLRQLPAHADAVWCVAWDAEGEMVLTAGADGLISHAAFTPSSVFLQASTLSSTLRIYNIHTGKIIKTIRAPGTFVSERWPCPAIIYEGLPPLSQDNESNGHSDPPKDQKMDVDNAQKDPEPVKPPVAMPNVKTKMRDAWIISGSENGGAGRKDGCKWIAGA